MWNSLICISLTLISACPVQFYAGRSPVFRPKTEFLDLCISLYYLTQIRLNKQLFSLVANKRLHFWIMYLIIETKKTQNVITPILTTHTYFFCVHNGVINIISLYIICHIFHIHPFELIFLIKHCIQQCFGHPI